MKSKNATRTLAIIPARGGSKSIPDKNIVLLGGAPLISYAIQAIGKAETVDRVIVSTDSEKIADVARRFGAEVPFLRPAELAEDTTPTIPVIRHAIEWLEREEGFRPDYVLLVQPTEPFVQGEHIDAVFHRMIEKGADSGITMIPVPRIFHPYHVRRETNGGYLEFDQDVLHYAHPNRQSDPKRFAFGNLYWFRRDAFLRENRIEVGTRVGVEIDSLFAHDINTKSDLILAESLLKEHFA